MAEERTYQGRTYRRSAPGEPWVLVGGQAPVTIGTPDPASAYDAAQAAADLERTRALTASSGAEAERARLEWTATHNPDGSPKPTQEKAPDPDRIPQIRTALDNIKRLRRMSDDFLAVGPWSGTVKDWWLVGPALGANRANIEGALQMVQGDLIQQQIARLSEMNGGKGVATIANSEPEAARMASSIANLDPNQTLEEFTVGLGRAEQYYLRQLARLEGKDIDDPDVRREYGIVIPGEERPAAQPPQAAGSGATEQSTPIPPEMQSAYNSYVASNWGNLNPDDYAAFRRSLDMEHGFESDPDTYRTEAERLNQYAADGIPASALPAIPSVNRPLEGLDKVRNDIVSSGEGTVLAAMANAGSLGLPSLLAGDEFDAMRDLNPGAAFAGDVLGGLTGTGLVGKGLGMLGSRIGAEALANPVAADLAYGTVYGATQADDPLYGAVLGGASALGGNYLGSKIGAKLGARGAEDTLAPGERAVFDAIPEVDPVAEALAQANSLGVPASLADVSPGVNSLTGAAIRRSPTVAGDARNVLGQRSRGQYDRLLSAVERDLGPVSSIPQRSEDLIKQARTSASPLYERAYAAPGAETVNLSDLADRPTFGAALREAYNEVLDEGLDPSAVGLEQAGDEILIASPSWQTLDYVKRGLDNIIARNTSKIDGATPEARRAVEMKNLLVSRMDEANPDYAAARAAYASPMQERAALQAGQDAFRMSPDQLAVNVGNASPTQVGQMQLGFQSSLAENAGRLRNNTNPFSILDTPAMEQRLASLNYGDDEIARLLLQRDMERDLASSTNRLIGNSMTAERQVADQAFGSSGLLGDMAQGAVETAITGAPVVTAARSSLGRNVGQRFRDWRTLGRGTALADEIGPIALNTSPAMSQDVLLDLAARDRARDVIIEELLKGASRKGEKLGASLSVAGALEPMR